MAVRYEAVVEVVFDVDDDDEQVSSIAERVRQFRELLIRRGAHDVKLIALYSLGKAELSGSPAEFVQRIALPGSQKVSDVNTTPHASLTIKTPRYGPSSF